MRKFWAGIMLSAALAIPAIPAIAEEASFLEAWAETYRFRLGRPTAITFSPDDTTVYFLRSGPRSFVQDLFALDLRRGEERRVLSARELLGAGGERLSAEEKARRERMRLASRGLTRYELSRDGSKLLVPLSGRLFLHDIARNKTRALPDAGGYAQDARLSPDGKHVAVVRAGELWVIDLGRDRQRRLTHGAGRTLSHATAEFVAQEEMGRHRGFWWSPDSTRIVYQQSDESGVEVWHVADPTRPESEPRGSAYPRPGQRNVSVRLGVVTVSGGPTTWIDWDRTAHEYLAAVRWQDRAPLTLVVQNRAQTEVRVLRVDARTGSTRTLLVERDSAWVDLHRRAPLWLPDGTGFVWVTERRGAKQAELHGADGSLRAVLHDPELGLTEIVGIDRDRLLVRASADPTESHLFYLTLPPAEEAPRRLTRAAGIHDALGFSASGAFVHHGATLHEGRVWEVVSPVGDGRRIASLAEEPPLVPRLEFVETKGDPSFHAVLVRPHDLPRGNALPVIVHVYGGPTSTMVRRDPDRYLLDQWIANHGFVVVSIDGRGTPGRGRDWSRAVHRNLIEKPLADQVSGLRALAADHPELDAGRVGIYGWSFGGYVSAMAAMRRGDVFRAAVAGAPVVDWADYDTHYTERYMGLPRDNRAGYADANALTWAGDLAVPLLLVHGTDDDNVYFAHSLKLSNALFRAGKVHEFLPLAGFTHMVPDPEVTRRLYERIVSFFEAHLQAEESP